MKLTFPTLLGILLLGLGIIVVVSAIRPAATGIGVILILTGFIIVVIQRIGESS